MLPRRFDRCCRREDGPNGGGGGSGSGVFSLRNKDGGRGSEGGPAILPRVRYAQQLCGDQQQLGGNGGEAATTKVRGHGGGDARSTRPEDREGQEAQDDLARLLD
jgi:hypothetical protein